MFFYIYSLVSFILYLLALPLLFLFSFQSKYKESIPARFFLWKNPPFKEGGVWFHSCSFGEAKAIKPLVDALPQELLRMSTTTQTGKSVIDTYTLQSRYLPFEPLLFGWLRPQKALVVMEAEFWYLLFTLAHRRGAKTLLINARMNDRSFSKYLRMRWFYARIFCHIDEVYAQTLLDAKRLEQLGATNVTVTGNLKLSSLPRPDTQLPKADGLFVCAASTHETEEVLILEAFKALKQEQEDTRLVIVPRHPERFERVAQLVADFAHKEGCTWHRFSQQADFQSDITLVDKMGELVNIYAISDLVILGGAFAPIGGHNAAEAAQFGCRIISGPHYYNQRDIFEAIEGIVIVEPSALSRRMQQYMQMMPTRLKATSDIQPILRALNEACICD